MRSQTVIACLACCALALRAQAAVVINEIQYNPRGESELDEFIELHNTGASAVDLSGWAFTDGVAFVFPEGTSIAPGGFLVVAHDPARIRAAHGLAENAVLGPYDGSLSNGGESLELEDAASKQVDQVVYFDEFPWPAGADGVGPSLECINPALDNTSPRNWLPSSSNAWTLVAIEGTATSNRLYFYLEATGECWIDDLRIVDSESGANVFPPGDFESGFAGWSATGTHSQSRIDEGEAFSGTHALRLIATGPGQSADTSVNRLVDGLTTGKSYRLSFQAKPIAGSASLISRVSGGGLLTRTDLRRSDGTPGRVNSVRRENLPPIILEVAVDPPLPKPDAPARLLATVEDEDISSVQGVYDFGAGPQEIALHDDGLGGDDFARDGVFTGSIPGAPSGSIVDYGAFVIDFTGQRFDTPTRKYPVAAFDVVSNLPVYNIFIRPADWDRLNADIWTEQYSPAVLVKDGEIIPDAGLRFRGGRPRLFRKKSLKLDFTKEHLFDGREELNLNAAAMDDDYITEPLAYWFYERCGLEAARARFVRVELNGEFWGLFIDVEQVDQRGLERFGLDPEGALYKAVGIVGSLRKLDGITYQGQSYTYETQYEKKTRKSEPFDDLIDFIHGLYDTPQAQMDAYLGTSLDVDQYVNYLAISNAMCVWDNMQHNYYFFRDTRGSGKWRVIPWDLDHAWGEWEWSYYFDATYHPFMGTEERPFANVWYTWNRLWTVMLRSPTIKAQYTARLAEILNARFSEEPVFRKIDDLVAEIQETAKLDEAKWPDSLEPQHTGPKRTMAQEIPLLKQNFTRRRQYLATTLGVKLETVPLEARFRRGDADGDGLVSIADAVQLLWYLFLGRNGFDCADAADADDNGEIDLSDPIRILDYLYRNGGPPPAPGPSACGDDPTADAYRCDYSTCE